MTANTYLPGAVMLRHWLESKKITPHRFAIENKIDPSELHKVLKGERRSVSVAFAVIVEDATRNAVPVRAWVPRRLEAA